MARVIDGSLKVEECLVGEVSKGTVRDAAAAAAVSLGLMGLQQSWLSEGSLLAPAGCSVSSTKEKRGRWVQVSFGSHRSRARKKVRRDPPIDKLNRVLSGKGRGKGQPVPGCDWRPESPKLVGVRSVCLQQPLFLLDCG
jgi:hypothetical protein